MLTNQQVIYLFYGAADVLGIPGGWTFIQRAGWEWLADDPGATFEASNLAQKPSGLSDNEWAYLHAQIRAGMGLPTMPGVDIVEDVSPDDGTIDVEQPIVDEEDDLLEPGPPKSLLGPAFSVPYNAVDAEKAYAAQPVVTKVIHQWAEVLRLAKEIPSAIHVYRHWDRWQTVFPFPSTDSMSRLVEKWMEEVEPERRQSEFVGAGGQTLLFEAFNEPDINNPDLMAAYTEFETLRIEELARVGCLASVGQFSVGSPNEENMTTFLPAIAALNNTVVDGQTGCLGVHEYGTVWPWAWMGRNQGANLNDDPFPDVEDPSSTMPAYLIGRFQHYYEDVFVPAGFGETPLILTETGLDMIVDFRILRYLQPRTEYPHGYRTCFFIWDRLFDFENNERGFAPGVLSEDELSIRDHEIFYIELLKWVDDFLRQFPFVKGALPFMTGGYDEWESFYIQYSAMTKFMDYVRAENVAVPV
jgi:hypothetical protein